MARKVRSRKYGRYNRKATKRWWHKPARLAATSLVGVGLKALKKKLGLNTENKNWDQIGTQTLTGAVVPFLAPINGLAQGSTNTTRTGNGLRVTHYTVKGSFQNVTANVNSQQIRMIITFQPTMTTAGTVLTAGQLLQTTTNIDSPYNTDLEGVKIIYDKTFVITPQFSGQVITRRYKFKWAPSYDDGHVQWTDSDTTGTSGDVVKGYLRCWIYDDQSANHPTMSWYSRVHFVDN